MERQDKKMLLQNRMLKIEIMDIQEAGKNEIEDCLWEWTTEVEWREDGYNLLDESKNKWRRMSRIWKITTLQALMKLQA